MCRHVLAFLLIAPLAAAQFSQPSYPEVFTYTGAATLEQTQMNMTFDGTNLWSCSGGSTSGVRLASYDATGAFLADYQPGISMRSVWTENDAPPVYGKGCGGAQLFVMTTPGTFTNDVFLAGGVIACQEAVVFDGNGDFIALQEGAGVVHTWDRASGALLGSLTLSGFGTMFTESTYPANRGVAWCQGHYLTYSDTNVSAWDAAGNRVDTTVLTGAGTSFDSHFGFSYAMGMAWVIDGSAGSTWRGYDIVLGGAQILQVDTLPATVSQGQTGIAVTMDVQSLGANAIDVVSADLTFTDAGAVDVTADYVVTPDPANPTVLAAGATETFSFLVDVLVTATPGIITLDGTFTGTDQVTAATFSDADADITDSWEVLTCAPTLCGDCNGDGQLSILDALVAAQHAASLITLTGIDFTNCNVLGLVEPDPGAAVDILDALNVAQAAAGLPVTLACC